MPEALAILLVLSLVGILLLFAWAQSRRSSLRNPRQELAQLEQHLAWLEERSRHAEEYRWGDDMKQRHALDLERTRNRIAEIRERLAAAAAPHS